MKLSSTEQYAIFDQAMKNKKAFLLDWKFPVEDIVFNVKSILPNLDLDSTPEKQVMGDWIETMIFEGKEYHFNAESETLIPDVMGTINKHLKKYNQVFVLIDPDDNWCFILINLSELPIYIENGFIEL